MNHRTLLVLAAAGAVGMALSCATLAEISPDNCGNGVTDEGNNEDCDDLAGRLPRQGSTPEAPTTVCAEPGTKNACRYLCESAKDCPAGWGCDLNAGHCARGAGVFAEIETNENGAVRMVKGDFDGDGRMDLVLSQPSGLDGTSTGTAFFFGEGMRVRAKLPIPIGLGALQTLPYELTENALAKKAGTTALPSGTPFPLSDLGFASSFGIGVLRGSADTPFVPELFPYQSLEVIVAQKSIKASQLLACPKPPSAGSSRGRVAYFLAFKVGDGTQLVPFSLDAKADTSNGVTLVGAPQDVRAIGAPAGEALCFQASGGCGQLLAWSVSKQSQALVLLEVDDPPATPPRIAPRIEVPGGIDAVGVGDIDGDGTYDIVIGPRAGGGGGAGGGSCPLVVSGKEIRLGNLTPVALKKPQCAEGQPFVGLADLNGDGVADFIYGSGIVASQRAEAGATIGWSSVYARASSPWTQIEHGDFDGDGRMDAILAVQGQAGLDVVRGTTGEIRIVNVPTPEPVDLIAGGYYDADRMIDIAYTTKVGRQNREASAYILFGGSENQTVPVGRKNVSQLVNLRRPSKEPFLPDVDFLGLVQDTEVVGGVKEDQSKAVLFSTYTPQGRAPVSVLKRATSDGIAGRGVAFGQLAEDGELYGLQIVLGAPSQCTSSTAAPPAVTKLQLVDDMLEPPVSGPLNALASKPIAYGPSFPIAMTAGRTSTVDESFLVTVDGGQLVFSRIVRRGLGPAATIDLAPIHRVAYAGANDCKTPNPRTEALYPQEKLALLDVDDDGDLDLVFSDGGRAFAVAPGATPGPGPAATNPGVMVVLRNEGNGSFVPMPSPGLVGRSFAKVSLGTKGPALAVLTPDEVAFYRASNGSLVRVDSPSLKQSRPDARALEAGDFDGDGVEDLAILAGGVLEILGGKAVPAGGFGDGGVR